MTTVFDASSLDATDDTGGDGALTFRIQLLAGSLAAATGTQAQVVFRSGNASGSASPTISGAFIGQAASAGSINFKGNQVRLTFSGGNTANVTAASQNITSDVVTLGETFDNTKDYIISVRIDAAAGLATVIFGTFSNVNAPFRNSSPGEEGLTTATSGYTTQNSLDQFLRQVFITSGAAPTGSAAPPSRTLSPTRGPQRGLQAVLAFPGAVIASGTWSSAGAANDAIWTGQSVGPPLALPTTQRILRPNIGPSRGLQQVKGFPPPAAAISSATWSSVGAANDAIWTGAAIDAATWSSVGSGVANWTGAATGSATWSSVGVGDSLWVGTGVVGSVWSSAGTSAATWVGIGISIAPGVWSSAGLSDAPWIGASIFAGIWSASGVGSANWTGGATAASTWASTGTGGASWTGAATAAGTWGSSGISDAPWVGAVPATQGALSSDGVGLAFWIGTDATPSAAKPGGAGYVLHYTRKRHRERIEELERIAAALLAKAETSKAEQRKALIKAAAATETVAGILAVLPAESIVEPALDKLVAASEAAIAARTRAAVVAQTTALVRYADLILEEAEEEEAEMLLFFN